MAPVMRPVTSPSGAQVYSRDLTGKVSKSVQMAGGKNAFLRPKEGVEDNYEEGARAALATPRG